MANFTELRVAYIDGMTILSAMRGKLTEEQYATLALPWGGVKGLAENTHLDAWIAANPKAYAQWQEDDHAYAAESIGYEFETSGPRLEDYGYTAPEWPDF